MMFVWRC